MSENLNNEEIKAYINGLEIQIANYISKNSDLLLNVKRLLKAGDAMQKRLVSLHDTWDTSEICEESDAWNAAKEGKPSV